MIKNFSLSQTVARDSIGRKLYSKATRESLIQKFRASGLSQAAFARQEKIHWTTLNTWLRKDEGSTESAKFDEQIQFQEISLSQSSFGSPSGFPVRILLEDKVLLEVSLHDLPELVTLISSMRTGGMSC